MEPEIKTLAPKKLIGIRMRMTLSNDRTVELWRSLMMRCKEIRNNINTDLTSMQIYDELIHFDNFSPQTEFEKWAAMEISDLQDLAIPEDMESHILTGGLYAVFMYKGLPKDFPKTAQYIFGHWLPQSEYELDHREHFEVLGDKYKNDDPGSEEEVWIPIRQKD